MEATKLFLKTLAEDRLQSSHRAALLQYSSDCTPQKVRQQLFQKSGALVWRGSTASTVELYVQQLFGTTFAADGSLVHFLVFKEPMVLSFGKSMACTLVMYTMGFPGLATVVRPREGITICHVVQDRGMSSSYRHALSGWIVVSKCPTLCNSRCPLRQRVAMLAHRSTMLLACSPQFLEVVCRAGLRSRCRTLEGPAHRNPLVQGMHARGHCWFGKLAAEGIGRASLIQPSIR